MQETISQAPDQQERAMAAIGYLGILCLVPLILMRKSSFAMHHGKQGLVLLIAWVILSVGNIIPILGQIVWVFGSVILFVFMILGIVNSFSGKLWSMPFLGDFAKSFKF